MRDFNKILVDHNIQPKRKQLKTLQVNIGKRCNQACQHCHVESGPNRKENMQRATIDRLIELIAKESTLEHIDITGGAPELNPHFRYFISQLNSLNKQVIDRCNLTVLFEKGQEDTAKFLANHQVQIIASLPCYKESNVDAQRGKGVFDKSILALKLLNQLGYGTKGSKLMLNLVYNPVGEQLPPPQKQLEVDYKKYLKKQFNISFNSLFTITNMPIKRYSHLLERQGKLQSYQQLLVDYFNPEVAKSLMCTELLSIGWNGQIFDCDFNQMLEMPIDGKSMTIWDIKRLSDINADISFADHCFACTAGSGSSCNGSLT